MKIANLKTDRKISYLRSSLFFWLLSLVLSLGQSLTVPQALGRGRSTTVALDFCQAALWKVCGHFQMEYIYKVEAIFLSKTEAN